MVYSRRSVNQYIRPPAELNSLGVATVDSQVEYIATVIDCGNYMYVDTGDAARLAVHRSLNRKMGKQNKLHLPTSSVL